MANAYLKPKEQKRQPAPKLTIDDIVYIARQIDKETGRYLSYGDVCTEIYAGRINPSDYLGRRVRVDDQYRA